ncbi:PREDICTED: esterase FE4-like [Dufourea novaeangliae]|uniref:esterase FE4-like n=1 Tax=Dufourea novaeangliae TaxID=178035 RepID=UPI00076709DB|nr:PREDICTED: esterase FE4-like [Dufourea novaeangliae]
MDSRRFWSGQLGKRGYGGWLMTVVMLLFVAICGLNASTPRVKTKFGVVEGVWARSANGRIFAEYLGIPYAEPPIGDLRFRSPQPWNHTWKGIYNATKDSSKCIQPISKERIVGSEDCLYLNVYVPVIPDKEKGSNKLPVIVFVHGGKYIIGASHSQEFPPDYMLNRDVILVSMNYRLNVMGFFTTANKVSPGNYGLKDILMSLHWVHDNIESFHGDSNSVTLWGHSAGAGAVHAMAFTKKTEGLFHRYILQSGSIFATWAVNSRYWMRQVSLEVARLVGCLPRGTKNSTKIVLETEENHSRDHYVETETTCPSRTYESFQQDVWQQNPCCPFGPVVEEESADAVITRPPLVTLRKRLFRDIPLIVGVTRDEGFMKTVGLLDSEKELIDNIDVYLPVLLDSYQLISNMSAFLGAVEEFYFESNLTGRLMQNITEATGDAVIIWPTYQVLRRQLGMMNSSVYFYVFMYEGTFSFTFHTLPRRYFGISHGDDLNYLMPMLNREFGDETFHNTETDIAMINIMTKLWANFATTGVPKATGVIAWPEYKIAHKFLRIGVDKRPEVVLDNQFLPDRMRFWEEVTNNFTVNEADFTDEQPPEESPPENHSNINMGNLLSGSLISLLLLCTIYLF